MIFPGKFSEIIQKPTLKLSWIVLFLNLFFYILILFSFDTWPNKDMREILTDEKFRNSVVEMYVQTLDPVEKKNLSQSMNGLYAKALKDQKFWKRVNDYPFVGDQVQIEENRKTVSKFYETYLNSPQHQFGLSSFEVSPWSWVTYQFVHTSLIHLLGNLLVVFLMISFLEKTISTTWLGVVYLLSGFAGGISFLFFDAAGGMSVIGASASASGLMGFLIIVKATELMPWGYIIAPIKNGYGQIYLPVFFLFPIFLVTDFVNLLWEPSGVVANVAVSAHVGGALFGFVMGGYYLLFRSKASSHSIFSNNDGLHELS
ncbi:MAG: rhomboid family intramembrane serine protease [Pseudobdellovibrio sp.]